MFVKRDRLPLRPQGRQRKRLAGGYADFHTAENLVWLAMVHASRNDAMERWRAVAVRAQRETVEKGMPHGAILRRLLTLADDKGDVAESLVSILREPHRSTALCDSTVYDWANVVWRMNGKQRWVQR